MFRGETAITIDAKGRMAIPTVYREAIEHACGNHLVVTYNPYESGCLWLFPLERWERASEGISALNSTHPGHRNLKMKIVGAAAMVEPDSAARILLPASQRSAAGIDKKAVLLGMGDRFEIWSEQAHLAKIRQTIEEHEISQEMIDLDL